VIRGYGLCKHVLIRSAQWLILIVRGVKVYAMHKSGLQSLRLVGQRQSRQSGQGITEWSMTFGVFFVALWAAWYTLMPGLIEVLRVSVCRSPWCYWP
jgi:hypothetical protein